MLEYLYHFGTWLVINILQILQRSFPPKGLILFSGNISFMQFYMEKNQLTIIEDIFSFLTVHLSFFYNNRTPVCHPGTQLLRLSRSFSSTLTTGCDYSSMFWAMGCKRKWCVQLLSLDIRSWTFLFIYSHLLARRQMRCVPLSLGQTPSTGRAARKKGSGTLNVKLVY